VAVGRRKPAVSGMSSSDVDIVRDATVKLQAAKRHAQPKHEKMRRLHLSYLARSNPSYGRTRRMDDPTD